MNKTKLNEIFLSLKWGLVSLVGMTSVISFVVQGHAGVASFNEVRSVVFNPAPTPPNERALRELQVYQSGQLPQYPVTGATFFWHGIDVLFSSAMRTLTDTVDYYPRLDKVVHPNGICFGGTWNIDQGTVYTGAFRTGTQFLFIGRASAALSETRRGSPRAFGFAGKVFPTLDPNTPVNTASFFTVDMLAGRNADHFTDVSLTNEPETGFRWDILNLAFQTFVAFSKADANPGFRPLNVLAEAGELTSTAPRIPHWMKLSPSAGTPKIEELDFRNELNIAQHYPNGLRYDISVSDVSPDKNSGHWRRIGFIDLRESVVSYGCDRQLHFHHPRLATGH